MELGNIIFGNSRGEYPLDRGNGWEEELSRLFDSLDKHRDNSWREYGVHFENDTFYTMPYYWGDCTCGYERVEWEFKELHGKDCYQTELRDMKIKAGFIPNNTLGYWLDPPKDWGYDKAQKIEDRIYAKLIKKFKKPKIGCAIHCTCDYNDRYAIYCNKNGYPNGHKLNCMLVRHNFFFKPMALAIDWYKYPLRDSYISHNIKLREFRSIIDKCIKSLGDK